MFKKIENLNDPPEVRLHGLCDAEKQLAKALPKLVVQFAKHLGHRAEAGLLNQTLTKEINASKALSQLAISSVNEKAMS